VKVFVTGGTGFVGSHLVEALLSRGDDVTCLVRNPNKLDRIFEERAPSAVRGDLTQDEALRSGCASADLIFHVAGVTGARNRQEFFAINEQATRRLTELAALVAPDLRRFVYISSLAAVGPSKRGAPRHADMPPAPVSDYGRSKLAGERAVQESRVPWTIVRPSSVYGPRDASFLTLFRASRFGIQPVFGSARQELSFIHARDLAQAFLSATGPGTECKAYFASYPEVVTAGEFVTRVHRAAKGAAPDDDVRPFVLTLPGWLTRAAMRVIGGVARMTRTATVLTPDKAHELLQEAWTCSPDALESDARWKASISLDEGLRETARWYRDHGWL